MKLGSLTAVSLAQRGQTVTVSAGDSEADRQGRQGDQRQARARPAVLKGGKAMSDAHSTAQVQAATPAAPSPPVKFDDGGLPPAEQGGQRDDPEPLPRGRPGTGDRRARIRKHCSRPTARSSRSRTQRLPDPGRGPGGGDPRPPSPTWSACRRSPSGARPAGQPGVLISGPERDHGRYDYLQELLGELNAGGQEYEVVVVQPEFDSRGRPPTWTETKGPGRRSAPTSTAA